MRRIREEDRKALRASHGDGLVYPRCTFGLSEV
jgi:hypothetical protein